MVWNSPTPVDPHRPKFPENVRSLSAITAGTPDQRNIASAFEAATGIRGCGLLTIYNTTSVDAIVRINHEQQYPVTAGSVVSFVASERQPDAPDVDADVVTGVGVITQYEVDSLDGATDVPAGVRVIEADWRRDA